MNDDIFESVSQGSNGAYDEENRRIQEVSNELQRLCRLHEEKPRDGKSYGSRFEVITSSSPIPHIDFMALRVTMEEQLCQY